VTADRDEAGAGGSNPLNELGALLISVKSGGQIFKEGDDSRDFFIIKDGSVGLTRTRDGDQQELEQLGVGDCVGEAAMLAGGVRVCSARALTDCTLIRIELGTLAALLKESPGLALGLLRKIAVRLLRFERFETTAAAAPPARSEQPVATKSSAATTARKGTAALRSPAAPAGSLRPAQLRHAKSGRLFALSTDPEAIVGRVDRATGFTPSINFSDLDEGRTIGRQHARILYRDGDYYVREDVATRNGTFVNGSRLPVKTEQQLTAGDRLRFGLIDVVFERG
jgi:CRP-like cAMP-binding protein